MAKPVAIIMGSQSDWPTMKHAAETLDELGVGHEALIVSAHRTPDRLYAFAKSARDQRLQGRDRRRRRCGPPARHDGRSDAAAGVWRADADRRWKARTRSCRSCKCRPACRLERWRSASPGAINAALLAAAVLALTDEALAERLDAWRARQTAAVGRQAGRLIDAIMLRPDATIGILGGGQLGRMLALAAARLGFKCHVFCPEPASPAFDVVRRVTEADYRDMAALARFADDVDVITYEFENVPAETAAFLSARKPVLPDPGVLATTQDRLAEKTFVRALGIATAPFAAAGSVEELDHALKHSDGRRC